jgi:mannose/fructose/N-acetylgalactosamine-specific phosphotransferase system component IID
VSDELHDTPPAGESIHLPGGTILPLTLAIGVTMAVVGSTIGIEWSLLGVIVFLVSLYKWIQEVRHEIDHLPDEHSAGGH